MTAPYESYPSPGGVPDLPRCYFSVEDTITVVHDDQMSRPQCLEAMSSPRRSPARQQRSEDDTQACLNQQRLDVAPLQKVARAAAGVMAALGRIGDLASKKPGWRKEQTVRSPHLPLKPTRGTRKISSADLLPDGTFGVDPRVEQPSFGNLSLSRCQHTQNDVKVHILKDEKREEGLLLNKNNNNRGASWILRDEDKLSMFVFASRSEMQATQEKRALRKKQDAVRMQAELMALFDECKRAGSVVVVPAVAMASPSYASDAARSICSGIRRVISAPEQDPFAANIFIPHDRGGKLQSRHFAASKPSLIRRNEDVVLSREPVVDLTRPVIGKLALAAVVRPGTTSTTLGRARTAHAARVANKHKHPGAEATERHCL